MGTREGASPWGCLRAVVLVCVVFLLVVVGALAYVGLRSESLSQEVPATLLPIDGKAQVQRSGSTNWSSAVELQQLSPGDSIKVDDGAGLLLYFFDGSRAYLAANSRLTLRTSVRNLDKPPLFSPILKQVVPDYPGPLEAHTQVTIGATLISGSVLIYSSRLASPQSYFRLDAPNATVQGSNVVYSATLDGEGNALVEALSGQVMVAGLASLPDESNGIAVSFLQAGRMMEVPALPTSADKSEAVARQRAAAWSIIAAAARGGAAPTNVGGLSMLPASEDNTVLIYRLASGPPPTPTPVPTIPPETLDNPELPRSEPQPEEETANDDQPYRDLPPGLAVTEIEDLVSRATHAQELLQPKGISVRSLSEKDLHGQLPLESIVHVQGGGVITASVQGVSYTITIGASAGLLNIGGLPPGVGVPDMPVRIIAAASEPGEVIIVYREAN